MGHHQNINQMKINKMKNIFQATYQGDFDRVKATVLKGGVAIYDAVGASLLHYACSGGQKEIAKFLLDQGAAINEKDDLQNTPLMYACKHGGGHLELATMLVKEYHADISIPGDGHNTAALWAKIMGHDDILEMLHNAEIDAQQDAVETLGDIQ